MNTEAVNIPELKFRYNWKYFIDHYFLNKKRIWVLVSKKHKIEKWLPNIFNTIKQETSFLPENASILERCFCLYENIGSRTICENEGCNNFVKFSNRFERNYEKSCSRECRNQVMGFHAHETLSQIKENGLTGNQLIAIRARQTKLNNIDENGLNAYQRAGIKLKETMQKVGIDGLTFNERKFLNQRSGKAVLRYYDERLRYQGSYEKYFLDQVKEIGFLDYIKNGPSIKYSNSYYRADFSSTKTVFEIKSGWTYDANGKDIERRICNNIKLKAALENNFKVILVWNKIFYNNVSLEELEKDISVNLLIRNDFNKDILRNIFHDCLIEAEVTA